MKRKIVWAVVLLALIALAFPLVNLVAAPDTEAALPPRADGVPDWAPVAQMLGQKCVHCHVPDAPLPFYARFPVAKGVMQRDIALGLATLDLRAELYRTGETPPLSEAAVAKVERAVDEGAMPPGQYLLLHWNQSVGDDDRRAVDTWVKRTRAKYFTTAGVGKAHAVGELQPLPDVASLKLDPRKVALGDKLFHDKRLSKDTTLSCASCHGLDKGGTDQAPVSTGVGGQKGPINSPTVFNAGLQYKQFWDGRAADLFEQADGPVNNPIEMAANWKLVIERLKADAPLVAEVTAIYPDGLTDKNVRDAIATFEKSLITPARFDAYLRGDDKALSEPEKQGLAAFREAGCSTCHVGRVLGGQSFEKLGIFKDYFAGRKTGDVDRGRYNVTKRAADRQRFKVPMLRNIAVTFPYFHDASARTLDEAVKVMAAHQLEDGLQADKLAAITTFLGALSGSYKGRPLDKR